MNNQPQFHHQHHQQRRQDHTYQQPTRNPHEQRREFLWRERVNLELQMQALAIRTECLSQEWQLLQARKVGMQRQKPKVAAQIILSGLVGVRSLPAERLLQYQRERILQEEARLQQAILSLEGERAGIQMQIEVINVELTLLP